MIFTVPYRATTTTTEHFPDLNEFSVVQQEGRPVLHNITRDRIEQTYTNLVFHGGDGATLEMRVFSEAGLRNELANAGFGTVRFHPEPFFQHGVFWHDGLSVPIVARPALQAG